MQSDLSSSSLIARLTSTIVRLAVPGRPRPRYRLELSEFEYRVPVRQWLVNTEAPCLPSSPRRAPKASRRNSGGSPSRTPSLESTPAPPGCGSTKGSPEPNWSYQSCRSRSGRCRVVTTASMPRAAGAVPGPGDGGVFRPFPPSGLVTRTPVAWPGTGAGGGQRGHHLSDDTRHRLQVLVTGVVVDHHEPGFRSPHPGL